MQTPTDESRVKITALPCKICGKGPRLDVTYDGARARTAVKIKCCGHWGAAVLDDRDVGFLPCGTHTLRAGQFKFTVEKSHEH